jgi:uncharacterized protein DUF3467
MAKEFLPTGNLVFETKGVPTVYANSASLSVSYYDIRVYFSELIPKTLSALTNDAAKSEVGVEPKMCLVCSPELAKGLVRSLSTAIEKYEEAFGSLRAEPTAEAVDRATPKFAVPASSEVPKE